MDLGDFGQIPGPSSPLFGGCAAAVGCVFLHKLQGEVTKAQVDTTTVYQKKIPSTGIPCIAVRVLGLNKSFWKGFLRLDLQPVQLIYPAARAARARAARAKQSTSPPTAIYPPIYLLYTWQQENQYMARARRGRAGFRKFP